MTRFLLKIEKLSDNKNKIYIIGLFFAFLIALKEVINLSYYNFQIFSYGSLDFWAGINPYINWTHLST